jgi:superfamily II DNA or RNA helicase
MYLRKQIEDTHRKLQECRRTIHDAAAMAVCIDQFHAVKVAGVIREVTGIRPSVIVSDAEIENDSVDAFRRSSDPWLVSVRKVSEGTDIKRLQVLCYLTNVTSELFFRQVIGRVSRVRGMEDYEGYVYLPADPRLIAAARNIENAQVIAVREAAEREERELSKREESTADSAWTTQHDGTEAVMIGNVVVDVAEAREIARIAQATGLSMQKVMEVRSFSNQPHPFALTPINTAEPSMEDVESRLRKECGKKAFQLASRLKIDVSEIHKRFKPQSKMSVEELREKKLQLVKEIARL